MTVKEGTILMCVTPTKEVVTTKGHLYVAHKTTFSHWVLVCTDNGRLKYCHNTYFKIVLEP